MGGFEGKKSVIFSFELLSLIFISVIELLLVLSGALLGLYAVKTGSRVLLMIVVLNFRSFVLWRDVQL